MEHKNGIRVDKKGSNGHVKKHHWTSKNNLKIIEVTNTLNDMIKRGEITKEEAINRLKKMRL